jgi:hypothetical protein
MGRLYEYTWRIAEHESPMRQVIDSTSGPFPTTLVYQLSADGGGTRVDFSVTGRPSGLMRVLQPMVARTTQKNLDASFARLKRLLEDGAVS